MGRPLGWRVFLPRCYSIFIHGYVEIPTSGHIPTGLLARTRSTRTINHDDIHPINHIVGGAGCVKSGQSASSSWCRWASTMQAGPASCQPLVWAVTDRPQVLYSTIILSPITRIYASVCSSIRTSTTFYVDMAVPTIYWAVPTILWFGRRRCLHGSSVPWPLALRLRLRIPPSPPLRPRRFLTVSSRSPRLLRGSYCAANIR